MSFFPRIRTKLERWIWPDLLEDTLDKIFETSSDTLKESFVYTACNTQEMVTFMLPKTPMFTVSLNFGSTGPCSLTGEIGKWTFPAGQISLQKQKKLFLAICLARFLSQES